MKTNIFSYLTMMALAVGMSACSDDTWTPDLKEGGEGQLNTASIVPTVKNGEAIVITGTQGAKKAASRATIDLSNYIIDVTDANGASVESWTFSMMPSLPTFAVGTYKVVVRSHNVQKAEWDKPYFFGEQNFQIRKDEVTDVEGLSCALLELLRDRYPGVLEERYKLTEMEGLQGWELLERCAKKRGMLVSGAQADTERMANVLLDEFRGGKLGNFTLEKPGDIRGR